MDEEQEQAEPENEQQQAEHKAAGKADDALHAMDDMQKRGEELVPPPEEEPAKAAEEAMPPAEEPPPIPVPQRLLDAVAGDPDRGADAPELPGLADVKGREMDGLAAKIPPEPNVGGRNLPGFDASGPAQVTVKSKAQERSKARKERLSARGHFKAMHDMTTKAKELGEAPGDDGAKEAEELDDAEVKGLPDKDRAEHLRTRRKEKDDAVKDFMRALVELETLEVETLIDHTRQLENLRLRLERERYF